MKVFGIAGYSGSGKTTLIERLIPEFTRRGLRVAVIKHAHHDFDLDQPGKDSWRHREAGAAQVLVAGGRRWALLHELDGAAEPTLDQHLARLDPCDLVLVEGYKTEPLPRLEVHRRDTGRPMLWPRDGAIVAIATDEPLAARPPQLPLDDPQAIADFVLDHLGIAAPGPESPC